ncbi:MAG TPA: S8 family serine peptidase, partial [Myxococcaceae bacterium]
MMTRWGVLALLAMTACGAADEPATSTQFEVCPGVVAGAVPERADARQSLSSGPVDDGRQPYLVRYHTVAEVSTQQVRRVGGEVRRVYRTVPGLAARLTPEERDALAKNPNVAHIEPDVKVRALSEPVKQGSTGEYTAGVRLVQAPQVWDVNLDGALDAAAPNGSGIRVCVLDSGIDPDHPELTQVYAGGKDFVDNDDLPWD